MNFSEYPLNFINNIIFEIDEHLSKTNILYKNLSSRCFSDIEEFEEKMNSVRHSLFDDYESSLQNITDFESAFAMLLAVKVYFTQEFINSTEITPLPQTPYNDNYSNLLDIHSELNDEIKNALSPEEFESFKNSDTQYRIYNASQIFNNVFNLLKKAENMIL